MNATEIKQCNFFDRKLLHGFITSNNNIAFSLRKRIKFKLHIQQKNSPHQAESAIKAFHILYPNQYFCANIHS